MPESGYPDRPPDLDTPRLNIWTTKDKPDEQDKLRATGSTMSISMETEEPFETRVYAITGGPVRMLFKILSKARKADGMVWWVGKLQGGEHQTLLELGRNEWVTEATYREDVVSVEAKLQELSHGHPMMADTQVSPADVTSGRTMLLSMQEALG